MPDPLAYAVLAGSRPGDPYVTWEVVPDQVQRAWARGGSVVWLAPSAYHGKLWLTGTGEPAAAAALVSAALASADGPRIVGLGLPEASLRHLPGQYLPHRLERWSWWWTQTEPAGGIDPAVAALDERDPRLGPLLEQSATVYLRPGDRRALGWYGLTVGERLVACLAFERHHPLVPHLASVVVDEPLRGRGFGRRLCGSAVTTMLREGAPAVSLAMMDANAAARELYRTLGFSAGLSFASGTIPGRRHLPAEPGWRPGGLPA